MADTLALTLWAVNMAGGLQDRSDWLDRMDGVAAEAVRAGSRLLVLPEYISELWLTLFDPMPKSEEAAAMAEAGREFLPGLQALADRHGLTILAGTWPILVGNRYRNAAHLFRPGLPVLIQHKISGTPDEADPAGWHIEGGDTLTVFEVAGVKTAIVTCLDIELPALSAKLAATAPDLDLILCPAMTERFAGYHRVFGCAKARAVELMCAVAAVGCLGPTPLKDGDGFGRANVAGAAVYLPCEEILGHSGRLAELPPRGEDADPLGPRLHVGAVPIGTIRALRQGQDGQGAEVWPGAFAVDHVAVARA